MRVFNGLRCAEKLVHGTVGDCDGQSLLEVTGHFCAIVGLAQSVRIGPLLGLAGSVCVNCVELVVFCNVLFFDLAFILAYDLEFIWHFFIRIYFVEIAWNKHIRSIVVFLCDRYFY